MASASDVTAEGEKDTSVHVFLPSHSYSLTLHDLALDATVAELKHAIFEQCPGRPRESGQRIIVQGKLLSDEEPIPSSPPRTVYLAVHPSAWTATPPSSPTRSSLHLPSGPPSTAPPVVASAPPSNEPPLPLSVQLSSLPTEFITYIHANALRVLSGQSIVSWAGPSELAHARRVARTVIKYAGLGWAPALDEDLPVGADVGKGLQYTSVLIDNLPYLALSTPDANPTPIQLTALRILTYTFPLLPLLKHLPRPSPTTSRRPTLVQPAQAVRRFGINVRVQRGGGAVAAGDDRVIIEDENPNAYFPPVPEFRFQFHFHLPPSRVLLQLLFTLSRAALLVYFFAPARKPLWLACIVGWIGWEMFVVLRHAGRERELRAARRRGNDGADDRPAAGGAPGGQGADAVGEPHLNAGPNARPVAVGGATGPHPPQAGNATGISQLIDRLANINLTSESNALSMAIRTPPSPPAALVASGQGPVAGTPPPAREAPANDAGEVI
ncbi:hypothetical protein BS47DRAFT_755366 [Hydnum rufescens UP504]|uniref:Ubiquitin-like domain-containing protein n=1 Tax=Hydnum rufescens UP504 TaxID=1448309 RepID=A0A9P6BA44_9AGAM|nr:hypothetical protein BS47DRAFT_755366 [Hydnum rufescens UP504]